jgi:hypothetical protein
MVSPEDRRPTFDVIARLDRRSGIPETSMIETQKPRRTGSPAFAGDDRKMRRYRLRTIARAAPPLVLRMPPFSVFPRIANSAHRLTMLM